jgi:hypothetical protein
MNSTNRGANRFLLLVTAVVLLAAAAVTLTFAIVPTILKAWGTQSTSIMSSAPDWIGKSVLGTVSLFTIGVGVVAIILAILLIVFIVKQGHGRTTRVIEQHARSGATLIDLGVPKTLLEQDLSDRPEFVSTRISAYEVKKTPTLKISVQCRRGISPVDAARTVTRSLESLDQILGQSIPALVQISGGFRSRVASRARLD